MDDSGCGGLNHVWCDSWVTVCDGLPGIVGGIPGGIRCEDDC